MRWRRYAPLRRPLAGLLLAFVAAGCAGLQGSPPIPDPASFPEIASQLGRFGVDVENWTAGDAGCDDPTLAPTAIRFEAQGLDEASPVQLRIYIFRNRDAWERRPKVSTGLKGRLNEFHSPALPIEGGIKRVISSTKYGAEVESLSPRRSNPRTNLSIRT